MKSRSGALLAGLVLSAVTAGCSARPDVQQAPPLAEAKAAGWTLIEPGGDTLCATGTPFRFHVRQGDPERVMIFLNGGGACWSGDLCDLATEPTPYTPFADMESNQPDQLDGVFDNRAAGNPFAGWTQVFVPYCTGDAHLGARDATYKTSAGADVMIHHRGKTNVQAALEWVYANQAAPERVFVTGGSAGAIASPYYAGLVSEHYPQAEVIQLADGAGGYRSPGISGVLEAWGAFEALPDWPEFASVERATATTEDFFRVTAARYPDLQLARFDNVDDEVQQSFLGLLGTGEPVRALLAANSADLARDIAGIRTFSAPGMGHTALRYGVMYSTEAEGVQLADWVRDLAEGRPVKTVSCERDNSCD
ncbi:pectin acetylesterase-family hydrolase [Hyphomonas sp.]|uniref:pectin acetylesterase-family hydrolase n=1 Tax=Hyphomonas sp. TaxID=87 RepID=UPI001BD085B5|nr:pectin acetylesterase-family hydrolase [Hyphomonas sp.]